MTPLEKKIAKREQLDAEIAEIKQRERNVVIARMQQAMEVYDITWKDLTTSVPVDGVDIGTSGAAAPPKRISRAGQHQAPLSDEARQKISERVKARSKLIMYRDDKGNEWNGMRATPPWIKNYEKKRGKKRDDLLTEEGKAALAAKEAA